MDSRIQTKKSLGQHWLQDEAVLAEIADLANLDRNDTALEIGPGLGTLTRQIAKRAGKVVAIEFDQDLARELQKNPELSNVKIINQDFLKFNLGEMPEGYKILGNIPYYITGKIVQKIVSAENKPSVAVLLVQKEVAERLAANAGQMSVLAVAAQAFAEVELGPIVPAEFFTPPPKVDSQVVVLKMRSTPVFSGIDERVFFRVVKAGFSNRRKKLRSSLAGGLAISQAEAESLLLDSKINPNKRAQELNLLDWVNLAKEYITNGDL